MMDMGLKPFAWLLLLVWAVPTRAEDFQQWAQRLESRKVKVSAGVWEMETGRLLEGCNTDSPLVPASTTKVVSTYALMKTWKPNFVLETEILGDLQNGVVRGDLVFKGSGDPFLTSERLWAAAQDLKRKGVQRVTGKIRLDQSAFDGMRYESGWANTSSDTTPPILPLSVNFSRDDSNRIVADPERLALDTISHIFREAGIPIDGQSVAGDAPRKLLTLVSPPLRQLVLDINKFSNNFMVEMLVKRFGEGSWSRGVQRIQGFYQGVLSLGPDKISITDGSGLSKENRLSARTLAIVLRAAWNDFEVGPEMIASLKVIGGEPWALRIKDANLARRVRCKTGHLANVISLCGVIQTPEGRLRVFAIVLNGEAGEGDIWDQVSRWAN